MKRKVPIGLIVTLEDENDSLTNPRPVEAVVGLPVLIPYFERLWRQPNPSLISLEACSWPEEGMWIPVTIMSLLTQS